MMRPISTADDDAIVRLSCSSGLFTPEEADGIRGMLDEYHSMDAESGHRMLVWEEEGGLIGIVYFTPKPFTDRVWELLMIAVDESRHRQGIGSEMLVAVEDELRAGKGRMLLIETSDKATFERTRQFYQKHGYTQAALIPDYFADGDGKVSFVKRL